MANDPYEGTNYDDSGMPLGTTTADFDNAEEVRKNMVRDKPEEPVNFVFDLDYEPRPIPDELLTEPKPEDYNGAIEAQVNIPGIDSDINRVDTEDMGVKRAMYVDEADKKGYTEVQELPKVEPRGNVEEIAHGENYDSILDPVLKADHQPDAFTEAKHDEVTPADADGKDLDTPFDDEESEEVEESRPEDNDLNKEDSFPLDFLEIKDTKNDDGTV